MRRPRAPRALPFLPLIPLLSPPPLAHPSPPRPPPLPQVSNGGAGSTNSMAGSIAGGSDCSAIQVPDGTCTACDDSNTCTAFACNTGFNGLWIPNLDGIDVPACISDADGEFPSSWG